MKPSIHRTPSVPSNKSPQTIPRSFKPCHNFPSHDDRLTNGFSHLNDRIGCLLACRHKERFSTVESLRLSNSHLENENMRLLEMIEEVKLKLSKDSAKNTSKQASRSFIHPPIPSFKSPLTKALFQSKDNMRYAKSPENYSTANTKSDESLPAHSSAKLQKHSHAPKTATITPSRRRMKTCCQCSPTKA